MIEIIDMARAAANSIASVLFMFLFLNKIFERKYSRKGIYIVAYLLSAFITWFTTLLQIPIVNVVRSILLINILCVLLYKAKIKSAVIYNVIFIMTTIFVDIITVSLTGTVWNQSISETLGSFLQITISNLLFWICSFLAYRLLTYLIKRSFQDKVQTKEMVMLIITTLFELVIIFYITALSENSSHGVFIIVILLGFLGFNIYFTRLLDYIGKVAQLKSELALANQQSNMQLKYYQTLMQQSDLSRKMAHDIRNHMQTLETLYSTGRNIEAKKYSSDFNAIIDKLSYGFKCSNLTLSIIISHQLQQAEANGITLELDVEDVPLNFINDLDITTIFANLLDNAIEACSQLDEKLRKVKMTVRQVNGFVAVKIANPIKDIPKMKDGIYETSKPNHEGIGLTNVLNAVKKYDGDFIAEIEGNQFIAKIIVSIPCDRL